jgi:hypothetical protein
MPVHVKIPKDNTGSTCLGHDGIEFIADIVIGRVMVIMMQKLSLGFVVKGGSGFRRGVRIWVVDGAYSKGRFKCKCESVEE